MSDQRYAPPTAAVADTTVDRPAVRPRSVTRAVQLFWVAFAVAGVSEFVASDDWTTGSVTFVVAAYFFDAVLNVLVGRGRNWARVAKLVILVVGVLAIALLLVFEPEFAGTERALSIASMALSVPATWWLFRHPGRLWFSPAPSSADL